MGIGENPWPNNKDPIAKGGLGLSVWITGKAPCVFRNGD